jgi:poly(3-hydroxybutyrate) depolymerase
MVRPRARTAGSERRTTVAILLSLLFVIAGVIGVPGLAAANGKGWQYLYSGTHIGRSQVMKVLQQVPADWTLSVVQVPIDGLDRYFVELEPKGISAAARRSLPVYVNLVGTKDNPVDMIWWSAFPHASQKAILVYPAGVNSSWDVGPASQIHSTEWWAVQHHIQDLPYLKKVVSDVLARTPAADPDAVYADGLSGGARETWQVACGLSGTFDGIAPVEGVPMFTCTHLAHPINIQVVARTGDPDLSFAKTPTAVVQGMRQVTVPTNLARWRRLDGCTGAPSVSKTGVLTVSTWHCAQRHTVVYDLYHLPAHTWPGGNLPQQTPGATKLIETNLSAPGSSSATAVLGASAAASATPSADPSSSTSWRDWGFAGLVVLVVVAGAAGVRRRARFGR